MEQKIIDIVRNIENYKSIVLEAERQLALAKYTLQMWERELTNEFLIYRNNNPE